MWVGFADLGPHCQVLSLPFVVESLESVSWVFLPLLTRFPGEHLPSPCLEVKVTLPTLRAPGQGEAGGGKGWRAQLSAA